MLRELKKAPWWVWLLLAGFSAFVIVGIVSAATDQSENTDEPANLAAPTAIPTEAPVAEPTAIPTEAPTAEPTATPDPVLDVTANDWRVLYLGEVDYVLDGCLAYRATAEMELRECRSYARNTANLLKSGGGDPECIKPLKAEVIDLFERIADRAEDALAGNASVLKTLDDSVFDLEDEYARLLDEIDAPCGP